MTTATRRPLPAVDPTIHLHPDLERLRLGAELALTLAPLIAGMVDEPYQRGILVADAVACWLALPASVRSHYQATETGGFSTLELFAWDYHAIAQATATATIPNPATMPTDADEEEIQRAAWSIVVSTIEQRQHADNPPADWLAQFPIPTDRK